MTKKKNDNDWNVHGRGTHCPSSQPALMGWELQVCASFGTVAAGGCAEDAGWLHRLHDTVFSPALIVATHRLQHALSLLGCPI